MPYAELHFNSALFSDKVAAKGNRNRRLLELNDPIYINKFHVKDLELPLYWCNVVEGTITFTISYTGGVSTTWSYSFVFPAGCYSGTQFVDQLQAGFNTATLVSELPATADPDPLINTITCAYFNERNLRITFPNAARGVQAYAGATVTWPESLKKYFSRSYQDKNLTRSITAPDNTLDSLYPIRLVPNYVYLHSNLMAAAPYIASTRALGAFASRTIVTKIQINTSYVWQQSVMPWVNPNLTESFMFELNNNEFNQLEFWFTDEEGTELDFSNVNFSLTVSLFYSNRYL